MKQSKKYTHFQQESHIHHIQEKNRKQRKCKEIVPALNSCFLAVILLFAQKHALNPFVNTIPRLFVEKQQDSRANLMDLQD